MTGLRDVPIIMITSRTGDKHRQRAFDIGVERYIGKPYQENELLVQINDVLEQSPMADREPSVALLFDDAALSAHLRDALVAHGARIVYESDLRTFAPAELRGLLRRCGRGGPRRSQ